jgi:hypothetical protein
MKRGQPPRGTTDLLDAPMAAQRNGTGNFQTRISEFFPGSREF